MLPKPMPHDEKHYLKAPEYHQEEDFRVVIWRKDDPNRTKSDGLNLADILEGGNAIR